MATNDLRAISTFVTAVKLGSIRKAALLQGITPQAASQSLAQLEKNMGVRLLHRTTRSLSLTDEGQLFLNGTKPALELLERALTQVRDFKDDIAGPLRIVGPRSSFAAVLMPLIELFCSNYPDVQPDVMLDDSKISWVEERVDVGFRIGANADEGLIARRLFPVQLIICAAPAYLQKYGAPQTLEELAFHRCSSFRHPATGQLLAWYLNIDGEIVHQHIASLITTNDVELELQAILSGQVIGQIGNLQAAEHIRAGRLVPILNQHMTDHIHVYLYYGNRASQPKRVRAFIELAIEHLTDTPQYVLSADELKAAARAAMPS